MDGGRGVDVKPRNLVVVFELLNRLLKVPDGFFETILARLDPTDCTLLAQVGRPGWRRCCPATCRRRARKGR